jgi:radical SAM superfamily enzyme YgiQ (UPF0313 family)
MYKVLFISDIMENLEVAVFEPVGLLLLSAVLKENNISVDICSTEKKEIENSFEVFKPDIVAYSITTGRHKFFIELNRKLKNTYQFRSIFGGPHPTFFPEMIQEDGVDIICVGEGEKALLELVQNLEQSKSISAIPNLWIKEKSGNIIRNNVGPFISDLDTIPFPDRELLNKYSQYKKSKIRYTVASRGCLWKCSYCFNDSIMKIYNGKGNILRIRSVDHVIEELKILKEQYNVHWIHFSDSNFVSRKEWILKFCDRYKKEINLPWDCNMTISFLTDEVAKEMKASQCFKVTFAIETGNEEMRKRVLNRHITNQVIFEKATILRKHKIGFMTQNMVGLPTSELNHDFETLLVNAKCKPAYAWVSICTPFPGTQLYEVAVRSGEFDGDINKISSSFFDESVLSFPHKKKVERLQRLFSLGVNFPFLVPFIKLLIKLTLVRLYNIISTFWKGYCHYFRLLPYKLNLFIICKTVLKLAMGKKLYKTYE